MSECECLSGCPFFNEKMQSKPGMSQIYKQQYCLGGEKESCARYKVRAALGATHVPTDLYPNQRTRAEEIIRAKTTSIT